MSCYYVRMKLFCKAMAMLLLIVGTVKAAPPIPIGAEQLEPWLKAGHYKAWPAESAPHESQGPHFGKVRAYLSPSLYQSMKSGAKSHPKGAAAVKELYGEGDVVKGWAVSVKTEPDGGANWYWYEKFEARQVADGKGVLLCRSCHFPGRDYVLTSWPLK